MPLRLGGTGERFELEIGIFKPDRSSPHKPDGHAYVRYYTGSGHVLFIDLVYQLLWGESQSPAAPVIEKYREDEIDQALEEQYSLYSFSAELAEQINLDLWYGSETASPTPMRDYDDMRTAMHDDRAFAGIIEANSGEMVDTRAFWGDRTTRVLTAVGQSALCL